MKEPEVSTAWAWEFKDSVHPGRWILCSWSQPDLEQLRRERPPTDDARPVCVKMIRNKDWREMKTRRLPK